MCAAGSRLMVAGWALFKELHFAEAFRHFAFAPNLDVARILLFWLHCLPPGIELTLAPAGIAGHSDDAPAPCPIDAFVREQAEGKGAAALSACDVALHNADAALLDFLVRHRDVLRNEERRPAEEGGAKTPNLAVLMRAVDAVLLRLLVQNSGENDPRLREVLDSGMRCTAEDCEDFLRTRGCLDVLTRLWKAEGMQARILEEWSALKPDSNGHPSIEAISTQFVDALRHVARTSDGADLLRNYVPKLLALDPHGALEVFAPAMRPGQLPTTCALSVDEVMQLLRDQEDVVLGYLEHLVREGRDLEPHQLTKLGLSYIARVAAEKEADGSFPATDSTTRHTLLRFLETTHSIDVRTLLTRAEALELHKERVVLYCCEQRHQEALKVLVEVLGDLPRAEIYCRVVAARRRRGVAGEVALFCDEPPAWARTIAFPLPRSGDSAGDAPAPVADGSIVDGRRDFEEGDGSRPLMVLLRVLLDAISTEDSAQALPAEALDDAVIALLTAYAGHRDLPPHEVIGLLPPSWSLARLAGYLSKSTRLCLHERRASMLEESLSSMAYLKTFGAWAGERQRKVHINGDRCCPVCNRRFVDKDSVGKAFIAYPNETCVHLQCKEDLSVCPKTGRNFADNLSVYCYALGTEPTE
eukprot:NODE_1254_length_2546_cov_4.906986.p1 GENE.NODE_1254_length_2546_cov_4.906986~~NODE_1254_length_2546_cov_4.906986.p1  ORF type:complete len:746 (-),score=241.14 NODE_1254_length_2546_cov_4.906986:309-2234(-)